MILRSPLRTPAAVLSLATALAATPVSAHGPIGKKFRQAPPEPPAPLAAPLTGADLSPPLPTPGEPRPLRLLAGEATAIVLADVARTEVFDENRLHVYRLHVVRALRGRVDEPEPAVVDIRGDSTRPALLNDGERAVMLLKPAPALSYLAQQMPPGVKPLALVAERDGVIPVGNETESDAVERALVDAAAVAGLEEAAALAARRRLAFAELGGPSPRLAADGVTELRLLPALTPLADGETTVLGRALRERRIEPAARVRLIALIADRGATDALPALAAAVADTPAVLDALLAARARLGSFPSRSELAGYLGDDDPTIRAAAVRALARLDDPSALAEVGRYATTDKAATVRGAAVEALGATHRPTVLPILAHTFDDPDREVMQKSARAMIEIGGPAADDTLTGIALKGGSVDTQRYAALLLVVTHGLDSAVVRHLAESNPSPEVRDVLEHGLEFHDTHHHE